MAVLSWDEIRNRALSFQNEWKNETSENAEAKSFWDSFFYVFGISRRRVATFEEGVKIDGNTKFVDLLWKGNLLVEHKSKGKNLDHAYSQAIGYFEGIQDRDLPRFVLVSDFERFRLYDLDTKVNHYFSLEDLHKNVHLFGFIAGYEKQEIEPQDPVNREAAIKMGEIHDELQILNYTGDDLDTLLVRLVFCLFADDTGIFNKGLFRDFLENNTNEDGTDLAINLQYLFEILDTPVKERVISDSIYDEFPYVNGSLFKKHLKTAVFNKRMRDILLECSQLDWGKISPAIFGSLFQSAMDKEKRSTLGAHYTSEENIMKVINPLFLEDLYKEFEGIKNRKRNKLEILKEFHTKLGNLNFLDPACGSGNFLIIAYRELRRLELKVLKEINYTENKTTTFQLDLSLDFNNVLKCDVNQFHGIEYDSFSAQIAQVALWIVDHQMNIEASLYFGRAFARLPLSEHANIVNENALRINWVNVLDPRDCDYILGNPPFRGTSEQNDQQKEDMKLVFSNFKNYGVLDYVSAWFLLASKYIQKSPIKVGLIATNSITQGQQVAPLWEPLLEENINIIFAYQSFPWKNDAKHNATVHVVIIGFGYGDFRDEKRIYLKENSTFQIAKNINPYLINAPNVMVKRRRSPVQDVKKMVYGNKPVGTDFIFNESEKDKIINENPIAEKYIKKYIGGDDFLSNRNRWCIWLVDANPSDFSKMPLVVERINRVKESRLESTKEDTRKKASTPSLFAEIRQKKGPSILVPATSSENRKYIPIGYLDDGTIVANSIQMIPDATIYDFGILTSHMHNIWTRTVSGRLEMRIYYSGSVVYNNFPWPSCSEKQKEKIEKLATTILEIRKKYSESSLKDLYNAISMPPELIKAHEHLDKEVDKLYNKNGFKSDNERLAKLFNLYEVNTSK